MTTKLTLKQRASQYVNYVGARQATNPSWNVRYRRGLKKGFIAGVQSERRAMRAKKEGAK